MIEADRRMVNKVHDERSFVEFIRYLADQRIELEHAQREGRASPMILSGLGDWEYDSIGGFFDGVAACYEDDAGVANEPITADDNTWGRAARILLYGKYYE